MINKIVFIGTPSFSVPVLDKMVQNGYKPELVITQPDKPKGRNRILCPPEVKVCALEHQIAVHQPENINQEETISLLKKINPDIIITISYGGFIGKEIRKMPPFGVLNIHPSLLPKYRGATPIQSALLNGDKETGVSIFKINARMDAGPVLFMQKYPLPEDWNFTRLEEFLSEQSAEDMIKTLHLINSLHSVDQYNCLLYSQPIDNVVHTDKVTRETMKINWDKSAYMIHNFIRAFSEEPGAIAFFRNKQVKIIESETTETQSDQIPGTVTSVIKNQGFTVSTQDYDLLIKRVQPEGKKIMTAHEYNIGARIITGEAFNYGL